MRLSSPPALSLLLLFSTGLWGQAAQPVQNIALIESISLERIPGALYRPSGGPAPHIGIIYQNGSGSMTSLLCSEMAKRGFLVLCTTGLIAAETALSRSGWETVALNVKNAVLFLRKQPGIDKVVLYGHSGGGAVASFYQAVAENGIAFCQDPKKLSKCDDNLANLPPADAVLFPDAHPGFGVMDLRDSNPSVVLDGNPRKLRIVAELDPFNPANGYDPKGSHYSQEFQQRYAKAQAERMNALIDRALSVKERQKRGKLDDPTEDIMIFPGGGRARIDSAATMSTEKPRKLLKNDGTIATQIIKSVAVAGSGPPPSPTSATDLTVLTVEAFLSRGSVRATDSISGIDYCSSNGVTFCNAQYIRVPVLFIASGAGTFIADNEKMYERSPAKDKDFIVVDGVDHSGNVCEACETTPGQYSNSTKNLFDYMANWINSRFPAGKAATR